MYQVLIVDDNAAWWRHTSRHFAQRPFDVEFHQDSLTAFEAIEDLGNDYAVIVCDQYMPNFDGMGLLSFARDVRPHATRILISALMDGGLAQNALFENEAGYVWQKDEIPEKLVEMVSRGIAKYEERRRTQLIVGPTAQPASGNRFIDPVVLPPVCRSAPATALYTRIEKAAANSDPVLMTGGVGVGKVFWANELHRLSRRTGPLLHINIGHRPIDRIEVDLFGYVEGGSSEDRGQCPGVLEAAQGGTVVINEVSALSPQAQERLFAAMKGPGVTVQRLGSHESATFDTRLVFIDNGDLAAKVETGAFRRDLYDRLNANAINVPQLREREDDISELFEQVVKKMRLSVRDRSFTLGTAALEVLKGYHWQGNIAELKWFVVRAFWNSRTGDLTVDDVRKWLPGAFGTGTRNEADGRKGLEETIDEYYQEFLSSRAAAVRQRVDDAGGNIKAVAKQEKIPRTSLTRWLGQSQDPDSDPSSGKVS
jgi:DNA-binding NtrC family response regulator